MPRCDATSSPARALRIPQHSLPPGVPPPPQVGATFTVIRSNRGMPPIGSQPRPAPSYLRFSKEGTRADRSAADPDAASVRNIDVIMQGPGYILAKGHH